MKTFKDKLQECPIEVLKVMIAKQKAELEIMQRDLGTMEFVLEERNKEKLQITIDNP